MTNLGICGIVCITISLNERNEYMTYLNAASTSQPTKEVIEDINFYLEQNWANPSDISQNSIHVKGDITRARNQIAKVIGAHINEIFFTSGGSESNNWAIKGALEANPDIDTIITTEVEHPSVYNTCTHMASKGYKVYYAPINRFGMVDLYKLERMISDLKIKKPLVSIMFANNEIGSINNIKGLAEVVHKVNGILHTDAVQAFMHAWIDVKKLGIDLMSVSGHKINCPKGIGFLYINRDVKIAPLIHGGKQEFGVRGGTENVPYICAMGNQVERIAEDLDIYLERNRDIYMYLMESIYDRCGYDSSLHCHMNINGHPNNRIFNNMSLTIDGINAEQLITLLDLKDVQISAGSACCSGSKIPSRVLKAIGLSDDKAFNTIRISWDYNCTTDMIDAFVDALTECILSIKLFA